MWPSSKHVRPRVLARPRSAWSSGVSTGQRVTVGRAAPQTVHVGECCGLSTVQTGHGHSFDGLSKRCHWYWPLERAVKEAACRSVGARAWASSSCSVSTQRQTVSDSSPSLAPKSYERLCMWIENQWWVETSPGPVGPPRS